MDPTSPRGKQAKLFAEKQEEEWRRAQERVFARTQERLQAAADVIHENPSAADIKQAFDVLDAENRKHLYDTQGEDEPHSDDSNNTATFMTVGTETFVDPGKSLRDELREAKEAPVSYDDKLDYDNLCDWQRNNQSVKANKKAPANADSKHSGSPGCSRSTDGALVELNLWSIDKAIAKWVKNVNKDEIDTADLYLGKLLFSEPEEMLQTVGDCISRVISEGDVREMLGITSGPRELHLCSTGLTVIPKQMWSHQSFEKITELFLQDNQLREVPDELVSELPRLMHLNLENNHIKVISAQLAHTMLYRNPLPGFSRIKLRLHKNKELSSPPLAVTHCCNPMDCAKLRAMCNWWADQGVTINEEDGKREVNETADGGKCRSCTAGGSCRLM